MKYKDLDKLTDLDKKVFENFQELVNGRKREDLRGVHWLEVMDNIKEDRSEQKELKKLKKKLYHTSLKKMSKEELIEEIIQTKMELLNQRLYFIDHMEEGFEDLHKEDIEENKRKKEYSLEEVNKVETFQKEIKKEFNEYIKSIDPLNIKDCLEIEEKAYLLLNIEPQIAATIIEKEEKEEQRDIILEMTKIEEVDLTRLKEIKKELEEYMENNKTIQKNLDTVELVSDILTQLNKDEKKSLLKEIKKKDKETTKRLKNKTNN